MRFFSIKMRSSLEEKHVSGHERIVKDSEIESTLLELYKRGSRKDFDLLNIKLQKITQPIKYLERTLKIENLNFNDYKEANEFAMELICKKTFIPKNVLNNIIYLVHSGCGIGKNMRGAMVVNQQGKRLEKDKEKGIRTSMVDFVNRNKVLEILKEKGFTERTLDALALSTKNLSFEGMLAEYCISDEPDYITGYVAVDGIYYRITPLKKEGNFFGGRIYFVKNDVDIDTLYYYLKNEPVLIKDIQV